MLKRLKLWFTPNKNKRKLSTVIHLEIHSKNTLTALRMENNLMASKILRQGEDPCQSCQIRNGKIDGGAFHAACVTCGDKYQNFIFDPESERE